MSDTRATELVNQMAKNGRLPALDRNVHELCALTSDVETRMADLIAIIIRDAALTSGIIALANSVAYRPLLPVKTISGAVILLGFDRVRTFALGMTIFKLSKENVKSRELYRLFTCSYFAGIVAMAIMQNIKDENPEEAFVFALLLELPKMLLANAFPDQYAKLQSLLTDELIDYNKACESVFGSTNDEILTAIILHWKMPSSVFEFFKTRRNSTAIINRAITIATEIADILFGNKTGGAETIKKVEEDLKTIINKPDTTLTDFLIGICTADAVLSEFFVLKPKDIEMMVKIAEWGKVSSAEVAASLAAGASLKEKTISFEEPRMLIGHFLSELMISVQKKRRLNTIMIAQEAIYSCLKPACSFAAFCDPDRKFVAGKFYVGNSSLVKASDFNLSLSERQYLITRIFEHPEIIHASFRTQQIIPVVPWLEKFKLEYVLMAPITIYGKSIGVIFIGREGANPFSSEEKLWVEAIASQISISFEQYQKP
jgi:HD-like signal output (HDOD) protein